MKKTFLAVCSACLLMSAVASAAAYSNFPNALNSDLKPFARDLGGLLGSGSNQTARALGFSGFDIGVKSVMQFKPENKNTILKKNNPFGLGLIQAEIGMPYRIDGFIRAGAYEGLTVAGGGLRYGIRKVSDTPYYLQVMLIAMGDLAAHKYFYAAHFNSSFMLSVNVPHVAPYFGIGFDNTKLTAQAPNTDPSLMGKTVTVFEPRYTFGLRAKLNLGYLAGGVTYTHGRTLVNAGAGLRF
ncbi:MAG TPA: hypothetical protein DER10_01285 [Elusimicrobia bacterium]|nr:hypothetical protein [Elusimicrobiota bacterium]